MPPTMPPRPARPRVLILRALGLGDLLAGVPALRGIRRAFPDHETVLAAPAGLGPAAVATGAVDALFPTWAPGREVPSLDHWAGAAPDIAIDLHGNGPESYDVLAALGPRRLLAYASPHSSHPEPPRWRAGEHERSRWCGFLRAYGIEADPQDLRLAAPKDASPAPGAVVVHPGADSAARRWPARRYAAVAAHLRSTGHRVVVTGGPGEENLCSAVAREAGLPARDVLSGGLTFSELSALLAHSALFVSGDTGPAHLAVAHGTPSVTLFGPVPPHLWGPPAGGRHTALWHPGPPGDPHGTEPDPLLTRIRTEEVVAAARVLLAERDDTAEATSHGR